MTVMPLKPKLALQFEGSKPSKKTSPLKFKVGNKRSWVPPGTYQLKVNSIEQKTLFQNKSVLEFLFEIATGDHRGVELRGFCNANYETFSENTKLYQWHAAVTGDELEPGDELGVEVFYKKVIEAEVEDKISRKTKSKFSNVTKILKVIYEL